MTTNSIQFSIGVPYDKSKSTCGYCSPAGLRSETKSSCHTAGMDAQRLVCQTYQDMIDRGWRRSGTWLYKPSLRASCCPQYPIRLDAEAFIPSKSHRKLINKWNNFVRGQNESPKNPQKVKNPPPFSLVEAIHSSEHHAQGFSHNFKITLEPASFTDEKFALFETYQKEIHKDDATPEGFERFLVESPLLPEPIPYPSTPPPHLPTQWGSFHQLYRLDDQLIAMAVLDILPNCVSSVYFLYDSTSYEKFSLGKLSALREISLVQELKAAGALAVDFLYLGYYIHSCPKMKYKAEYSPSYLCDPETYQWFPMETCQPLLDRMRYAVFSDLEKSVDEIVEDTELPTFDSQVLQKILVLKNIQNNRLNVTLLQDSKYWSNLNRRPEDRLLYCLAGLGPEVAKSFIFM
ncbi:arginine-tRNA-protein transferase [Mycena floridula]|nr:arginine-tRNA-protein transferase [Mycena floridula]